jgi:hypothetical protein
MIFNPSNDGLFVMARRFTSRAVVVFTALLILTMAFSAPVCAQDCTPDDITLSSQAEVDNFQANHGPCNRVLNVLTIGGGNLNGEGSDIVDLDGLSTLNRVGRLDISNNAELTNVDGLTALNKVDVWFHIGWNEELRNLNGLSGLSEVGENFFIRINMRLGNVDGLSGLNSVGGIFLIFRNPSLDNLNGLSNLTSIGEGLDLVMNGNLSNVDGLSSLTRIGGDLSIQNESLINLNGLSGVTSIGGGIIILNTTLTELDGLSNVPSVGGDLWIVGNPLLTNLDGLSGLPEVQELWVERNQSLADCQPLVTLVDPIDQHAPGPGPGSAGIPDVADQVIILNNLEGCNSVLEILGEVALLEINAGLNDAWFSPDTDGQGFFIIVFPEIKQVFMAWFTYETERPPADVTAFLGEPGHRWLTAQGEYVENVAALDILKTSGGVFDSPEPEPVTEPYGEIMLEFSTCNAGTVTYDIPSVDRQGVIPIGRIVLDNVSLCYMLNSELADEAIEQ